VWVVACHCWSYILWGQCHCEKKTIIEFTIYKIRFHSVLWIITKFLHIIIESDCSPIFGDSRIEWSKHNTRRNIHSNNNGLSQKNASSSCEIRIFDISIPNNGIEDLLRHIKLSWLLHLWPCERKILSCRHCFRCWWSWILFGFFVFVVFGNVCFVVSSSNNCKWIDAVFFFCFLVAIFDDNTLEDVVSSCNKIRSFLSKFAVTRRSI